MNKLAFELGQKLAMGFNPADAALYLKNMGPNFMSGLENIKLNAPELWSALEQAGEGSRLSGLKKLLSSGDSAAQPAFNEIKGSLKAMAPAATAGGLGLGAAGLGANAALSEDESSLDKILGQLNLR
jgi:hypothetical protein